MSPRLPLLAEVDPQQLGVQSLLQSLRRSGVHAVASTPPPVTCLRFELGTADGAMVCCVDANAWAAVHLPGLVGLDWSSMDPTVLAGLTAVDRPLQFADAVLDYGHALALPPATPSPGAPALPSVGAAEGEVWIESRMASLPSVPAGPGLPAGLPLLVRLQVGHACMSLQRLHRLRRGDIVLLSVSVMRAWQGRCPLFDFHLHPDSLTVTTMHSPFTPDPDATATGLPAELSASEARGLDTLPLTLDVTLCRLDMSLGELAALEAGSVVALPDSASQRVELGHNGRRLAVGELVQVGDRLGVKLALVPGRA